ncbi:MAG: Dam family site-specific DNA-(adenine-N6)-methyltransferase [Xanthobacteraceae bacterium]
MIRFPMSIRPKAPPIKSQGIKTKLVPFILKSFQWDASGRWIEPFVGSGAVAFNAAPKSALLADSNKHLIAFYQALQTGELNPATAREYLEHEGAQLEKLGEDHYYAIRERFNKHGEPLDFLFLSRACFNGMMRFNSKGGFNVPFCRKPERFRPAYVTKICNQIGWAGSIIRRNDWVFVRQSWQETLRQVTPSDFAYIDPPYIGRHTDYFNSWDDAAADELAAALRSLPCGFAYSMWAKNEFRENEHLIRWFSDFEIARQAHFYYVGPTEDLRHEMEEALVVTPANAVKDQPEKKKPARPSQLPLL